LPGPKTPGGGGKSSDGPVVDNGALVPGGDAGGAGKPLRFGGGVGMDGAPDAAGSVKPVCVTPGVARCQLVALGGGGGAAPPEPESAKEFGTVL